MACLSWLTRDVSGYQGVILYSTFAWVIWSRSPKRYDLVLSLLKETTLALFGSNAANQGGLDTYWILTLLEHQNLFALPVIQEVSHPFRPPDLDDTPTLPINVRHLARRISHSCSLFIIQENGPRGWVRWGKEGGWDPCGGSITPRKGYISPVLVLRHKEGLLKHLDISPGRMRKGVVNGGAVLWPTQEGHQPQY